MNIKELRAGTGLSQAKFSEKYGIPERTIQDWEAGVRKPSKYVVKMLAYIIANEKANHTAWVFHECRDSVGLGHSTGFKDRQEAIEYGKAFWDALDPQTRESYLSDPTAVFFVAEMHLGWNPYGDNFYYDFSDVIPAWDAIAEAKGKDEK